MRYQQLLLTAADFTEKVGFFFSKPTGSSLKRTFGEFLVKEHGWSQKIISFVPRNLDNRMTTYVVFFNPNCKHLENHDFSFMDTGHFYGFDGDVVAKSFRQGSTTLFESRIRTSERKRMEAKDKEMEAQKILGEGVFNMVRRNRATFFQRVNQ